MTAEDSANYWIARVAKLDQMRRMKAAPKISAIEGKDAEETDVVPRYVRLAIAAMGKENLSDDELGELADAALASVAVWNERDWQNKA